MLTPKRLFFVLTLSLPLALFFGACDIGTTSPDGGGEPDASDSGADESDAGPSCENAFLAYEDSVSAALDTAADIACTDDGDCFRPQKRCNACGQYRAVNATALARLDEAFPESCDDCTATDPQPCPEPEDVPPSCVEGECE